MSDIHVIPINDLREHEDSPNCWCHPNLDEGVWVHNSMDGREILEGLNLQCGEIPLFLAKVAELYLDPDRFTSPKECSENLLVALQWLDKREKILFRITKDKISVLSQFISKFFSFKDESDAIEDALTELGSLSESLKPVHLFRLCRILGIPITLLFEKDAEHLITSKADLELLAAFAVNKDFISQSKAAEILSINAFEFRDLMARLKSELESE